MGTLTADLGWVGRRRNGPALRAQIDAEPRVLTNLQRQLRELPAVGARLRLPAVDRPPAPPARERLLRQPVERGMGLER